MELDASAAERLARLGYDDADELTFWKSLWEDEGPEYFWRFLASEEAAADDYRRNLPRLQAYAAECRRVSPVRSTESFSSTEKEQHRILLSRMWEFDRSKDRRPVFAGRPHQAAILFTTPVGLAAAEQVFGGGPAVILEESEQRRWFAEAAPSNDDRFWWYAFAWWTLREGAPDEDAAYIRRHHPIPGDCTYWVVTSGVQWGPLAGGARHDLWQWDGRRAEFIALYSTDSY